MERKILLLGNPKLYEASVPVGREEDLSQLKQDLHDTLMAFRRTYHAGRAIAAPQIGVQKRVLYMYIDKPMLFLNPVLRFPDEEMMEVLDDCMSFPTLYVRVLRHKRCIIDYFDETWQPHSLPLEGDLSELLQHEYDHLDGILATMRAIDSQSLVMKRINSN